MRKIVQNFIVIASPSSVILSGAKNLIVFLRINSAWQSEIM